MENEDFNINRNMHEDFDYDNTDVNGESENNITYDMLLRCPLSILQSFFLLC